MTSPARPTILAPSLQGISPDLKRASRWGAWKLAQPEDRPGDWTKVPYSALTGRKASSTNLADWTSFAAAVRFLRTDRSYDGPGFCLGDGFAGIDFDGCRDPETGVLEASVREWVKRFDSYTEVSPSGTGVKVFMHGRLPEGATGNKRNGALGVKAVEVYDHARYFTVTGHPAGRFPRDGSRALRRASRVPSRDLPPEG